MRWPAALLNVLLVGLSVALTLGLLELSARLATQAEWVPARTLKDFRLRQPEPYQQEAYFSRDFIAESFRQPGGWDTPSGTRLVIPRDYAGTFFHVANGQRRTTDQPATFRHRVWVLGGSTVYASEVPDAETIPSHMQRVLNARTPDTWRVENVGASTVTVAQQLERLRTLPVQAGDVVVFYDGVNDILQGVFSNNPDGWMVQSNRDRLANQGAVAALALRAHLWLTDHSALYPQLVHPQSPLPAHLAIEATRVRVQQQATLGYVNALGDARAWARARGARFVHVLQPNLGTRARFNAYETGMLETPFLVPAGSYEALRDTTPLLRRALADVGLSSTDLTALFDDSARSPYLDFCHMSGWGNARVAAAMADVLALQP